MDRFVEGLKYNVKLEVMKSTCNYFEDSVCIELYVDRVIWKARQGKTDSIM